MKRIVSLLLCISMLLCSTTAFALPNSEKDPDGTWQSLIKIMAVKALQGEDGYVSDIVYNDCFCLFMTLYMGEVYGNGHPEFHEGSSWAESVMIQESSIDDMLRFACFKTVLDSYESGKKDNKYSLGALIVASEMIGGYDDVESISEFFN